MRRIASARRTLAGGLALLTAACGAPADGVDTDGDVPALPEDGVFGQVAPAAGGVPSVVVLEADGVEPPPRPEPPHIDQFGLQFSPRFVVVRVGEPMIFRNSESIAHNVMVHAAGGGPPLLNADTPPNDSVLFTFEEAGAYDVTCEVHPGMTGLVFVTDAPFGAFAEPDGTFAIAGVPPGEYTLRVWSVDPDGRIERSVTVDAGEATEIAADSGG